MQYASRPVEANCVEKRLSMGLSCLLSGHEFKLDRKVWVDDFREGYLASNGIIHNVTKYEHERYVCSRCLKSKLLPTGKIEVK